MEQVVETAHEAIGAAPSAYRGNTVTSTQDAPAWRSRLDTSRTPFYTEGGSPIFFQREVISGCPAWVGVILLVVLVVLSLLGL
jgi:hypothetical protein